jgi:AMP nucleosidase
MKDKAEIVRDWLPRYTGRRLEEFGHYVLLVNFSNYVELFAERFGVPVAGRDRPMLSATAEDITILSFGMGSAMAATTMDLLSAVSPKAVTACCGAEHRPNLQAPVTVYQTFGLD